MAFLLVKKFGRILGLSEDFCTWFFFFLRDREGKVSASSEYLNDLGGQTVKFFVFII